MSTDEKEKQPTEQEAQEKILAEKFDNLTRDVDLQWYSLGTYIEENFKSTSPKAEMSPSELVSQNVLAAYLYLADKFYKQFGNQLKEVYEQSTTDSASMDHISDTDVTRLMQQALDKLTTEWARVYAFISGVEAKQTSETQNIQTQLKPLIAAAMRDAGFSPESFPVIPQFGTTYSLGFFNYTDDFMALNLPITALKSPWEWTIFWHEIAGQKVRLLKKAQVEFQHALVELFIDIKRTIGFQIQQAPSQSEVKEALNKAYGLEEFKHNLGMFLENVLFSFVLHSQSKSLSEEQTSDFYATLKECIYDDFMSSMMSQYPTLTKTREFIQDLSPAQHKYPLLMFSFDDLLDKVMQELRSHRKKLVKDKLRDAHRDALMVNKKRTDEQIDKVMDELFIAWDTALSLEDTLGAQKKSLDDEGWSADWLEELFEDSFSVMNFDASFLPIFDRLLRRYADGGRDLRHPPHHIRLAMAAALKLLDMDDDLLKEDQDLPPKVDSLLARNSNKANQAMKRFYPGLLSNDSLAAIWLVAKKFREMHERIKMPPDDDSDKAIQKVKDAVTKAMRTNMVELTTPENIEKTVKTVLDLLAESVSALKDPSQDTKGKSGYHSRPGYELKIDGLLNSSTFFNNGSPLGFRELLDLSFYDVDFLGSTITDVQVNGSSKNWTINWKKVLSSDVKNGKTGPVTYKVDSKSHATTVLNWNVDFGGSEFRL